VFTHELGGLNRVRPHVHRLRRRDQDRNARCGILDRVLRRAPEQAAGLGAVTQRMRTPGEGGGVLEYRYLMESLPSGRFLANCRKFTAIT